MLDSAAALRCCSSVCLLVTVVFRNELLRPLTGLSGFGSPSSSSRSQLRSRELAFHGPPLVVLSMPLHTRPGLQGRSGSMEEDETEEGLGSADCWGTSHRGLSLLTSQPSGAPLFNGCSHWGATREDDGWVVTVCSIGTGCSTCCLRERGSSGADMSKEFLCVEERREDETPTGEGVMGGSSVCDLSCMSITAWPAASDGCRFELLLPSAPFQFSWHWGLEPPRLCPEDTGLENTESDTWKSWRSIVVL